MSAARPAWRAYVTGENEVIDRLVDLLAGTGLEVTRDGQRAYLHGGAFDAAGSASDARKLSQTLLPWVNAALRLDDVTWPPVILDDQMPDGAGSATAFAEAHIVARSELTAGGDPGPRVWAAAVAHAQADGGYAVALKLFGASKDLKWVDIYKVYELLQKAAAGDLAGRAGVTGKQISAFTQGASDAGVRGSDARRAIPSKQPPRRTMTLPEARQFIRTMLRGWT